MVNPLVAQVMRPFPLPAVIAVRYDTVAHVPGLPDTVDHANPAFHHLFRDVLGDNLNEVPAASLIGMLGIDYEHCSLHAALSEAGTHIAVHGSYEVLATQLPQMPGLPTAALSTLHQPGQEPFSARDHHALESLVRMSISACEVRASLELALQVLAQVQRQQEANMVALTERSEVFSAQIAAQLAHLEGKAVISLV